MDDIINSYRELAFRMSVHAANNPGHDSQGVPLPREEQKGVAYTSRLTQVQYAANIPALILAVTISLAGPLATMSLLWGWWKLGSRKFSMSPLELANTFVLPSERADIDKKSSASTLPWPDSESDMEYNGGSSVVNNMQREKETKVFTGLFVGCNSNASADELADHFRLYKGKKGSYSEGTGTEPKIQYGALNDGSGGGFSFSVV